MSPIPSIYAHLVRVAAHSLSRARTRDNTTTSSSFSFSSSSSFSSSLDNISVGHFSLFPLRPSIHHHYHFPFTGFSFFYPSPKEGNPISIYTRGDRYDLIGRALSFLSFLSLSLSLSLPSSCGRVTVWRRSSSRVPSTVETTTSRRRRRRRRKRGKWWWRRRRRRTRILSSKR